MLAAVATAISCAAWTRKGPAAAPRRVAAAPLVRNTALTRPSAASGMTRCMVVCGITSDMEPNMPTAAAAGSAVASDVEVNSRKYAAAVAVRLAVSRWRGWARSRSGRMTGAPIRKPAPRLDSRYPVCSPPPSRWMPRGMRTALSDALAVRKMTVTGSSALARGCARSTRVPWTMSRATPLIVVLRYRCWPRVREVRNMAPADSR